MNPCCQGEGGKQPLASSPLSCSFHPLKASQSKLNSTEMKPGRVKRRRTRKERNYVKFGRNVTNRVPDQRPTCRGLQKMLPPFWGSQLIRCATSTPIKGSCGANPVIITQNRLTQHLGMFNRKVKSASIERLLSPRMQQHILEATPLQTDCGAEMQLSEDTQPCKSCDSDQKPVPSKQRRSSVNDPCGGNEDSLPTATPAVPMLATECHSVDTVHAADVGSQLSPGHTAVEFDQQFEIQTSETKTFQSHAPVALNEKENVPPLATEGAELGRGKMSVRELAQDLQKLLDLKAIFPGRNLINETRQAVIGVLLKQKKTLPDFSALVLLKKLADGQSSGAAQAGFKRAANRDQGLQLESKSSSGNRNFDVGVSLKKSRSQEEFLHVIPTPRSVHTARRMAEERPTQRVNLDFLEPEEFGQCSFNLAAARPQPNLLSATFQPMNSVAEHSFASEEQSPLQEALFRTAQHWERGLREALWESGSRQEKIEVSNRQLPKKNLSKRHCLPVTTHHSWGSISPSMSDKGFGHLRLADQQRYSCVNELSPEQWNLWEKDSVLSLHPSRELCSSQPLNLGFKASERAATESQTSFDVLKSIWSPKVNGKGTKRPGCKALSYPPLVHQPSSSRELNLEQGQPKEFFQLYGIIPQQHCSLYRQNPQQEVWVPSRQPQHGNGMVSALSKPRSHCQKVSLEQGRMGNSYPFRLLTEAPARIQGRRDKGCPRSGNQAHDLERLLQMERVQQLQIFQQLPMSYFPPSEALENSHSPHCTLQGQLLRRASPEPWAFPRMKLY